MNALRSRRSLLVAAVLFVALAIRVGQIELSSYTPINDARIYLQLAGSVARIGDYPTSSRPGTGSGGSRGPSALFPPGYPYFLAAVDWLDGRTAIRSAAGPARLSQALVGTVTVWLIGLVALEAFGGEVGLVALGLAAVYPVLIETSGTLLVENLLLVFELAAVYCGLRIRRAGRSFRWAALAGVFTGLAALTHQNGLVLLVPLAVVAWSSATCTLRVRAFTPAIMLLALVLTLTPWAVRNAVELHSFIPISDQAGETLFGTYNPVSAADHEVPYKWRAPYRVSTARALNAQAPQLREPAWENRLLDRALAYIGAHPFAPVAVSFHNTMELLDLEGSFAWETSTASINIPRTTAEIGVLAFWAVAVLAVLGSLTPHAQRAPRWLWLVPILFFVSTVWVRAEAPRFRLAIDPFVVMLAACALVSWVPRLRALGAVARGRRRRTRTQPHLSSAPHERFRESRATSRPIAWRSSAIIGLRIPSGKRK